MVALPLCFLLFSLLELAMIFMIQTTLENATYNAARTIRTGATQTGGGSATTIKTAICNNLTWLGASCTANVTLDVRSWASFPNPNDTTAIPDMVNPDGASMKTPSWLPGGPGDIVLVRAYYKWTLITPFLAGGLQRMNGGISLITASSVFRNEPYQ